MVTTVLKKLRKVVKTSFELPKLPKLKNENTKIRCRDMTNKLIGRNKRKNDF